MMPGENPMLEQYTPRNRNTEQPALLPVSCGYFFNIVRQLLMKQRKQTLKYILLEADGRLFDQLAKNISSHSLTDLLIELMQLNIAFPTPSATHITLEGSDEEEKATNISEDTTQTQESQAMRGILERKKKDVIKSLLKTLSQTNFNDIEASLNASAVLNELIEIEKTFELFWLDNAALIEHIIDLAIDPSNSFNQKYLLNVLIAITKQLKPAPNP